MIYFMLIHIYFNILCSKILSIKPSYLAQKSAVKKSIIGKIGAFTRHKIYFYFKFHYKLNHIEYFWCNRKSLTRRHCKYSIESLRKDIPKALSQI